MRQSLKALKSEFVESRSKDLGMSEFMNWTFEYLIVSRELDHAISNLWTWMQPVHVPTSVILGPALSSTVSEPLGIVSIIGNWHFPLVTTIIPLISAVAAGNCAIIKVPELTVHCSKVIRRFVALSLDPECFQCVQGGPEVFNEVLQSHVDLVVFTGSVEEGKLVAQATARNLIPCVLELGGKSAMIVDKTANIPYTALKTAFGAFLNFG